LRILVRSDARQAVRERQLAKTPHVRDEHRIVEHENAVHAPKRHLRERVVKVARRSRRELRQLQLQDAGGRFHRGVFSG
jgi:hypothetical protein